MLNFLDIQTLCFVSIVISSVLCICMLYVQKTRKTYSGFSFWTIASVLYCLGFALITLRHSIPDFFSIIIGNALIVAGNGCVAHGIEIFTYSKKRLWLFITLTLFLIILFVFFTYVYPSVNTRIVIISTVIAIIYFYSAFVLQGNAKRLVGINTFFMVIVFSVQAIWNAIRIIQTIFYEKQLIDFFGASTFHSLTVIVFFCGNIIIIIGLIILNSQRVEQDLKDAHQEVSTLQGLLPICSHCKSIRNDSNAWERIENYIEEHSEAQFSHGICPDCLREHHPDFAVEEETSA